tara:strand:- start:3503 stop:3694 length:192 start_codon:yes stop_codon:yes gene_type:complete
MKQKRIHPELLRLRQKMPKNGVGSKEHIDWDRIRKGMKDIRKLFGTYKFTKPTQQIMDEIDEG